MKNYHFNYLFSSSLVLFSIFLIFLPGCYFNAHIKGMDSLSSENSLDKIKPSFGSIEDGIFKVSLSDSPMISWAEAVDEDSGVDHYEICLGTSVGLCDIVGWQNIGSLLSYQFSSLGPLADGVTYYPSVKALDKAGNETISSGDGWVAVAPPQNITAVDDDLAFPSANTTPTITWTYPGTLTSGLPGFKYQVALGSSLGGTNIAPWTDVGTSTSWSTTGLSLTIGNQYYATIRITDALGNIYSTQQGDGWYVVNSVTSNARYSLATNWNNYVLRSNPLAGCSNQGYFNCIHGGENKRVDFATAASCSGYTIADELGAFDWACDATGGAGNVFFYSRGLKKNKGLADLVTTNSWKNNRVVIFSSGIPVAASNRLAWWTNTVTPLQDSAVASNLASNTIYTLSNNMTVTSGYTIFQGAGVVTLGSSVLTINSSSGILFQEDMTIKGYIWLEGNFKGTTKTEYFVVFLAGSGVVRRVNVSGFLYGIGYDSGASYILYSQVNSSGNAYGAYLKNGASYYLDSTFSNNDTSGIYRADVSNNNVFMNIVIANNPSSGFYGYGSSNNKHINFTVINNNNMPIYSGGDNDLIFHNIVALNNSSSITLTSGNRATFSQLVTESITTTSHNSGKFTGNLLMPNTSATCAITAGTNPGLVNGTCANQGSSNANFLLKSPLSSSTFVGPLSADDAINASDMSGSAAFSSITDWNHFENMFRSWMNDQVFPSILSRGQCASGNCRILDLKLKNTDTLLRNTTDNGTAQNAAFVNGATCPSQLHGNRVSVSISTTVVTYLTNAYEILGTGGNNNGLCESNETCLYSPNFGAYQGEGDFWSNTCTFQNGTITNVKMYAYPTN